MILFIVLPSSVTIVDSTRALCPFDLEFFQEPSLFIAHPAPLEQLGSSQPSSAQRLL
jgi:hypothetical protein